MRTFKLIKCYPGSPELGTIVSEFVIIWQSKKPFHHTLIENYPEFWEEVIEEPKAESPKEVIDKLIDKYFVAPVMEILKERAMKEQLKPVLFSLPDENGYMVEIHKGDTVYWGILSTGITHYCNAERIRFTDFSSYRMEKDFRTPLFANREAAEKWLKEYQEKKRLLRKPERSRYSTFYFLNEFGVYSTTEAHKMGTNHLYQAGNYFHTKEQAEYAKDNYPISKLNQFWEDLEKGEITI